MVFHPVQNGRPFHQQGSQSDRFVGTGWNSPAHFSIGCCVWGEKKKLLPIFSNLLFNACLFILFLDCTQCYRHHPQQCWNYFCSSFFKSFSPLANLLLCYCDKRSVWIPPVIDCLDCYWSSSLPLLHLEFTLYCASNYIGAGKYYYLKILLLVSLSTNVFIWTDILFWLSCILLPYWNNGWAYFLLLCSTLLQQNSGIFSFTTK
jgi:hypothetical protein